MITSFYTFMKFSYSTKVFSGDQYHAQIFYGLSFANYPVHWLASDCFSFDFKSIFREVINLGYVIEVIVYMHG